MIQSSLVTISPGPQRQSGFQCLYIRPDGKRFQLVMQWVQVIDGDFTFDEEVLETADTPHGLSPFLGRDIEIPPHPSQR